MRRVRFGPVSGMSPNSLIEHYPHPRTLNRAPATKPEMGGSTPPPGTVSKLNGESTMTKDDLDTASDQAEHARGVESRLVRTLLAERKTLLEVVTELSRTQDLDDFFTLMARAQELVKEITS